MRNKTIRPKLRTEFFFQVTLLICFSSMAGCKNFFIDPALTSIAVSPATPSVVIGKSQQMIATGTYDNGTTDTITDSTAWATSDSSIATVSSTGLVTGVAAGSATVSATLNGISGSTTVTVTTAALTSLSISSTSRSLSSGQTAQFTAIGTLQNGKTTDLTDSVTWKSSNTSAAAIDSSGLAKAKTVSTTSSTNITARSGSTESNSIVLSVSP